MILHLINTQAILNLQGFSYKFQGTLNIGISKLVWVSELAWLGLGLPTIAPDACLPNAVLPKGVVTLLLRILSLNFPTGSL